MDFQFPVHSSPAAGASHGVIASPALQRSPHMRSAPPSRHPPVPGQPRGHAQAGAMRDAVVSNSYCDILSLTPRTYIRAVFQVPPANAAGDHRRYEDWEDLPPVDQPQDLPAGYGGMGHYDMANNHLPLHEHHNHAINDYAGLALNDPAQAQAAPLVPVCPGPIIPHTLSNQTCIWPHGSGSCGWPCSGIPRRMAPPGPCPKWPGN
jgi:hypothetical protein